MTRREARIITMQILYTADLNKCSIDEAIDNVIEGELSPEVSLFIDLIKDNLDNIDSIISKSLVNYSIDRLNVVDKAIIRLATAELLSKKTDKKIVINEALEITKEYSDQGDRKATSFNNRLLDNICKNI